MENVSAEELKKLQLEGHKLLIDYWAPWCGPCRVLIPKLEVMENDFPNVKFVKINIDENIDAAIELGIMSVPTVLIYDGKNIIQGIKGLHPDSTYKEILETL